MLSTCQGAAGGRPRAGTQHSGYRGAQTGEERRRRLGSQEWPDGARYEGEFMDGLKHGRGKYTWENGEHYEGSFYKDYRHGEGVYCWPTGHKFIGKLYLNRKEGYGLQLSPDGTAFQGLYHVDQRFGPGVVSYPDGGQDVGLWHRERLLRLCTSIEGGFSLNNFPEYAAYMDPTATIDSLTQVHADQDLLSDERFVLPPDMESYSTDGDHLPLPPGRRRELDQRFHGELWEPDPRRNRGHDRDPLCTLPLLPRMQALIHTHRLQAAGVGLDVAAVLSLSRERFGPRGPLEVSSEQLIRQASLGERQAVSQSLHSGSVHPDVADARGHTALIAATVNCHNDVIHVLLDMGADIDKLNCEGMSALAVCHVLYYPIQSLHTTLAEKMPHKPLYKMPKMTTEELTEQIPGQGSDVSDDSDRGVFADLHSDPQDKPETDGDTEHFEEEQREEEEGQGGEGESEETDREGKAREGVEKEGSDRDSEETEREGREREVEGEIEGKQERAMGQEEERNVVKKRGKAEADIELSAGREIEAAEEDEEEREKNQEEDAGEREEEREERSIQVLDGHIPLGSVRWWEGGARTAGALQQERGVTPTFDSARSVESYRILVTEEVLQRSAEALSRTGIPQRADTQETVRKMAAMKTEHRARWNTLKLLLERGADPNASRVPVPVLFLAVKAADTEAVRRLLLCGTRTDIPLPPERNGLYPLHIAAALPGPAGPRITELLLHAVTDPDAQANDQDDTYELDKTSVGSQAAAGPNAEYSSAPREAPVEGGRTALHVACQRDSDYSHAREVVALLLSHRASTHLLWSGHSPLSLAIASGNDLAVEELLKGGADPNLPLGRGVGSALCALANINYHSGGHPCNKAKLLDMLVKAGANMLMPVMVGEVLGTAVDYAHYAFNQDLRIANTPFHALNMRERETFNARRQLLSMMGDLQRQAAVHMERERLERDQRLRLHGQYCLREHVRSPLLKFCYQCGRSVSVVLTACSRCHQVLYCSRICKLKAWDERHKDECIRVSARGAGNQQSVGLKPQRSPRPLSMAQQISESHLNLKENYSSN
ncbi:ankyrin repeat and MYND domain-containing protein 1 [Centroberyx affinis]|uniref:ankyrin repeat and MYND domain-containing protein 1 n=1 Tax=Centroberyx affinis TaxID=166261 RepID=UPI003A5BDC39